MLRFRGTLSSYSVVRIMTAMIFKLINDNTINNKFMPNKKMMPQPIPTIKTIPKHEEAEELKKMGITKEELPDLAGDDDLQDGEIALVRKYSTPITESLVVESRKTKEKIQLDFIRNQIDYEDEKHPKGEDCVGFNKLSGRIFLADGVSGGKIPEMALWRVSQPRRRLIKK